MSKFKVGDKVRRTESNWKSHMPDGCDGTETVTVVSVGASGYIRVEYDGVPIDGNYYWCNTTFELVEAAVKFKVGDRVRCMTDSPLMCNAGGDNQRSSSWNKGKTITVKEIDNESRFVMQGDKSIWHYMCDWELVSLGKELIAENNMCEDIEMKETTFEDVKEMPKAVLKEANKEVLEEIAEEQKVQAKVVLRRMYDEKIALEERTKEANDKLDELVKDLGGINK